MYILQTYMKFLIPMFFFEGSDNINKHKIPSFVVDFFSSLIIDLDQSNNKTTNKVCHIDAMI